MKFKVGDKVKLNPDVSDFIHGQGPVEYSDIGVVIANDSESIHVDFPGMIGWWGKTSEIVLSEENVVQQDQWDISLRGEKMSSVTGKTIFKYQIPTLEKFTLKLPKGAEIIRVDHIGGLNWLWAVVDTNAPDEERKFRAFKTGGAIPSELSLKYVGYYAIFVQQELGLYIFEEI